MYTNKKIVYCSLDQINNILKYCYENRVCIFREKRFTESFGLNAFIVDRLKYLSISYSFGGKAATYLFDKSNGDTEDHQQITGLQAFTLLNRYVHINRVIDGKEKAPFSAKALLYKNPNYEGKRIEAICYDMNSAYSYAMLQPMPDTSIPPKQKYVEKGEIGFDLNGNRQTQGYSLYVFNLMESPFKKFVNTYYKKKKEAKIKADKRRYKEYLNFTVGFLQGRDPFTRAQIVGLANDLMKSLIDENTLYCNTDSIVSITERPELKIGDEVGEWKIEHRGLFAYKGFNYQWDFDLPTFRGKLKSDFYIGWDILKDPLPECRNKFCFNQILGEVRECEN